MRTVPRVFVASSLESLRLARAVQQNLKGMQVTVWNQGFRIGHMVIDELVRNLQQSDFGVFVFAPEDILKIREQEQQAVRDNVVLELGMFIGRLGKERSFIVKPDGRDMRMPTDLLGIVTGTYDSEAAKEEPQAALGDACTQIADAVKYEHRRKSKELNNVITDALETICRFMGLPLSPQKAKLRAFIFRKEGEELVCRYFWDPYQSEERVGTTRFRIDEETAKSVVVVRCYLDNAARRTPLETESAVAPLPKSFKGVKGSIKPTLNYVLAAPIRKDDDSVWGVVDFDASNEIGKKLLQKEETANAVILRLAKHLSSILAQ
ncbi:MAG TPA: nucleotide-binding protein [Pyrinomonadaceae bacterium]|nr:nucleotide-binding protein [Pyrinomonadaceae bacterium]